MSGAPHTLYFIVNGTEPDPLVDLLMHSDEPGKLIDKIHEEIKEDETMSQQGNLNETALTIKKEEIVELKNIESDVQHPIEQTKEQASDKKAANIAVEQIASEIKELGDKSGKKELKNDADTAVAPDQPETKPAAFDQEKLHVGDVIVEIATDIGYVVKEVKKRFPLGKGAGKTEFYGFAVHYEPNARYFAYDYFDKTWTIRAVTAIRSFAVAPIDPYKHRLASIRVGQANWATGTPAGSISDNARKKIGYDPQGNEWNQAGHLVAASLGGPGSFRSAGGGPGARAAGHN